MKAIPLALLLVLATLSFTPTAVAAPCGGGADDAPAYAVQSGTHVDIYQETNGRAGLQRQSCIDENGRLVGPDQRIASLPPPIPQCIGNICIP